MHESQRFGRFEIRPAERAVLVDGRPAALGARAFDLLVALVDARDRVVPKDELLDAVWPGVVVEENNLAVHVSALRKVLGARTIATVPGRGYQFVAPLEARAETAMRAPPPAAPPPVPPPPAAPPLGRAADLAALEALWPRARCVSIVGAGGIGKTTLARAAAQARRAALPDGVAWVELAALVDASNVPAAIAQALRVETADAGEPMHAVLDALRPRRLLLVLDNAEHLLDAVARVVRVVLAGAPGVQLLVTSQAPLRVDGEHVFRLGPLAVPDEVVDAAQALAHGAVALFAEQASAADRRFALTDANVACVVALCRHLDGVPLALKLAAARVRLLGLNGLVSRLGDRLRLLRNDGRDAPARQLTLQAALDWSHGLLDAPLQAVFRRLAVFAGSFPLELVERVVAQPGLDGEAAAIDALAELVDRSLVEDDGGDPPRYRLPETVREYARERLEASGEAPATQQRHAQALAAWMEDAYERYWSVPDRPWLERHAPELDNVRAALDAATRNEPALAVALIGCAGMLFMLVGHAPEARRRFAALEHAARHAGATPASARYWLERSRLQWGVDNESMRLFAARAATHYRALGDRRGLALALRCLIGSEVLPAAEADAVLAEMTALEPPDAPPRWRAQRLLAEVSCLRASGRVADACAAAEALFELSTEAGLDGMAAAALALLASGRLAGGDTDGAIAAARRLMADPRARRGMFLLRPLGTLAEAYLAQGRPALARDALAQFVGASRSREWEWFGVFAGVFALLAASEGRLEDAARILGYADRVAAKVESRNEASAARARARAAVAPRLDEAALARLMAEGGALDESRVCALALSGPACAPNDPIDPAGSPAGAGNAVTSSGGDA